MLRPSSPWLTCSSTNRFAPPVWRRRSCLFCASRRVSASFLPARARYRTRETLPLCKVSEKTSFNKHVAVSDAEKYIYKDSRRLIFHTSLTNMCSVWLLWARGTSAMCRICEFTLLTLVRRVCVFGINSQKWQKKLDPTLQHDIQTFTSNSHVLNFSNVSRWSSSLSWHTISPIVCQGLEFCTFFFTFVYIFCRV